MNNDSKHTEMILRKADLNDSNFLLNVKNDPKSLKASRNTTKVTKIEHEDWLKNSLINYSRDLYIAIIVDDNTKIGSARADLDQNTSSYELSWAIAPKHRGKGYCKKMVELLILNYPGKKLIAEIKTWNKASIKIAEHIEMNFAKEEIIDGVKYFCYSKIQPE